MPANSSSSTASVLRLVLILAMMGAACLGSHAVAQVTEPSVAATISPGTVGVGREAVFSITVLGAAEAGDIPDSIQVDGLDITFTGEQRFISSRGTQRTIQLRINYSVVAESEGAYTIPGQTITVNGQPYTTDPVRLLVREGAEQTSEFDPFLKILVPKTEFYQGEIVPMEVELYVHSQTNLLRYSIPELSHQNFVVKRFERPSTKVNQINNMVYTVYSYPSSISAIRPGEFDLGPARLEVAVGIPQSGSQYPSFFQRQVSRNFRLPSNTLGLTIKPLPAEGKPAGFTGAVGQFKLSVGARPTELKIGDPIALDIVVSGLGNFDAVAAPELTDSSGWRLYPASQAAEHRSSILEPGSAVFNQVIIPERKFAEIPSLAFSYFDPDDGRYVVLTSDPIPLQMAEAPAPSAEAAAASTSFATAPAESSGTPPPSEELQDILHIINAPPAAWAVPVPSLLRDPVFWAIQVPPLAALVAMVVLAVRRLRKSAREVVEQDEPRTADTILRELRTGAESDGRRFYRLVAEFLSHPSVSSAARSRPELQALLRKAESAAYGGESAPAAALPAEERRSALRSLESLLPA